MSSRRNFLQTALVLTGGVALGSPKRVFASADSYAGIVYTKENPVKWSRKVGSHLPQVSMEGKKVTLLTGHPTDKKAESSYELPEGDGSTLYATSFCNNHDFWVTEIKV